MKSVGCPVGDRHVVVREEDWDQLLNILHQGGGSHPATFSLAERMPLAMDHYLITEDDVFGAQGMFAYAACIHSAVEYTAVAGLSLMTQEQEDHLTGMAMEITNTATRWMERRKARHDAGQPNTLRVPD